MHRLIIRRFVGVLHLSYDAGMGRSYIFMISVREAESSQVAIGMPAVSIPDDLSFSLADSRQQPIATATRVFASTLSRSR